MNAGQIKKVTQSGLKPKEIKGFQSGFESV